MSGALAFTLLTGAAQAANDPAFCRSYASEAVEMQNINQQYGCGFRGPRWHTWWDGHFGWCKDWVNAQTVEEEILLRRIRIDQCREGGDRRTGYGDNY